MALLVNTLSPNMAPDFLRTNADGGAKHWQRSTLLIRTMRHRADRTIPSLRSKQLKCSWNIPLLPKNWFSVNLKQRSGPFNCTQATWGYHSLISFEGPMVSTSAETFTFIFSTIKPAETRYTLLPPLSVLLLSDTIYGYNSYSLAHRKCRCNIDPAFDDCNSSPCVGPPVLRGHLAASPRLAF